MNDSFDDAVEAFAALERVSEEKRRLRIEADAVEYIRRLKEGEEVRRKAAEAAHVAALIEWEKGRPERERKEAARLKREAAAERKEQRRIKAFEAHLRGWPWHSGAA